jgi:hypothetical protein
VRPASMRTKNEWSHSQCSFRTTDHLRRLRYASPDRELHEQIADGPVAMIDRDLVVLDLPPRRRSNFFPLFERPINYSPLFRLR